MNDPDVEYYSVHWDSKKIKLADGSVEERLVVLVKPINSDKPAAQFLGAPRTPDGTGNSAKDAVVQILEQHGVPRHKCILSGFDTTASNTGHHLGAAILIETDLGEPSCYNIMVTKFQMVAIIKDAFTSSGSTWRVCISTRIVLAIMPRQRLRLRVGS